jgi:hypothetical protein
MNAVIKWSSLQKSVSIFTPKKFYEINPRSRSQTFFGGIYSLFFKVDYFTNIIFSLCALKRFSLSFLQVVLVLSFSQDVFWLPSSKLSNWPDF